VFPQSFFNLLHTVKTLLSWPKFNSKQKNQGNKNEKNK